MLLPLLLPSLSLSPYIISYEDGGAVQGLTSAVLTMNSQGGAQQARDDSKEQYSESYFQAQQTVLTLGKQAQPVSESPAAGHSSDDMSLVSITHKTPVPGTLSPRVICSGSYSQLWTTHVIQVHTCKHTIK